jgi:hypothetical protein
MKENKETSCNSFKWDREGGRGERQWGDLTNVHISLFGIVTMNLPCTMNVS